MLKVKQFTFNPFAEHSYLVYDPEALQAIVIDPGMATDDDRRRFDSFVSDNHLTITQIVNTHLHLDHCFGVGYVRGKYGAEVAANPADGFLGQSLAQQARQFGIVASADDVSIDVTLRQGDTVAVGSDHLEVIETPGHTPGGICLYSPSGNFLISGDTLFRGSVGRTDLPGGDHNKLISGIKSKIYSLPDATLVLPGHGPATTVAEEKASNPFTA